MKLKYTAFGFTVTIETQGYSVYVVAPGDYWEFDSHGFDTAMTKLGAIYKGWRLARMYARESGHDQSYMVFKGVGPENHSGKAFVRTIYVTYQVSFFSK